MADKIRRVRCGTPKCSGFIDTNVSTMPKSEEGNWQFHCAVCGFWSLFSEAGMMRATSRDEFDLTRLPPGLRGQLSFTRSPGGGV
jgi:hypothetical protein